MSKIQQTHTARLIAVSKLADETLLDLFHQSEEVMEDDIRHPSEAEFLLVYCARVSNPSNQTNLNTAPRLLRYLMAHRHWSPLEMASMTVEVETTRSIAAQILRHRSASFQEFSQRYADPTTGLQIRAMPPQLRTQDHKNRQASHDNLDPEIALRFTEAIEDHFRQAEQLYRDMLAAGIARECARDVLPLATPTRLYMAGTLRTWVHYLLSRTEEGTQDEHRLVALEIARIFREQFPVLAQAIDWHTWN